MKQLIATFVLLAVFLHAQETMLFDFRNKQTCGWFGNHDIATVTPTDEGLHAVLHEHGHYVVLELLLEPLAHRLALEPYLGVSQQEYGHAVSIRQHHIKAVVRLDDAVLRRTL